tara:strand:+ start:856 stop:1101 length:246 start_codon:yes stop_codon:yes gene_type:complete
MDLAVFKLLINGVPGGFVVLESSIFHKALLSLPCISNKTRCKELDLVGLDKIGSGDKKEDRVEDKEVGEDGVVFVVFVVES